MAESVSIAVEFRGVVRNKVALRMEPFTARNAYADRFEERLSVRAARMLEELELAA